MALTVTSGDLFESEAQTLANTVNCVGVMGKGIALEFRRRFPSMYDDYVERCQRGVVRPGRPYLHRGDDRWILNFPTKDDWRRPSRLEWVTRGLEDLVKHYREWGIASLPMPLLGCGLGGLDKTVVVPILHSRLNEMGIPTILLVR